jgi:P27 family predicted phage terminase small subunit
MSNAGRPRKPTALKALEGGKGKRAPNGGEPDPDYLDNLEAPAWMPEEAKKVWSQIAFPLRKAKLLAVIDVPMLEMACVAIANYRRATLAAGANLVELKEKEKEGGEAAAPQLVMNPWLIVQAMSFKQASAALREFGMSPSARSRVVIDPQFSLFGPNGTQGKEEHYFTRK